MPLPGQCRVRMAIDKGLIRTFRDEIEDRIDNYHAKHPKQERKITSNQPIGLH
jgi:NADH dehydrogenase (ubiquinone) flavoprotein 1